MNDKHSTDSHLGPLLEYFIERLNRVYAHFFCVFEFEGDPEMRGDPASNDRTWSLLTIQNGCLHATLLAIRDLDDFLIPRDTKSKIDDLKASDFGYTMSRCFLTKPERELINKSIAHTTTTGAQSQNRCWDIWELTSKCVTQCIEFLRWIEGHFGLSHFLLYSAALGGRIKVQKIHAYVASEILSRKGCEPSNPEDCM